MYGMGVYTFSFFDIVSKDDVHSFADYNAASIHICSHSRGPGF